MVVLNFQISQGCVAT